MDDEKIALAGAAPWWTWLFMLLCLAAPVLTGGGVVGAVIGAAAATLCYGMARRTSRSKVLRLLLCGALTVTVASAGFGLKFINEEAKRQGTKYERGFIAKLTQEQTIRSGGWLIQEVTSGLEGLTYSALALAPSDTPYIAYINDKQRQLHVAKRERNGWKGLPPFLPTNIRDLTLALDAREHLHMLVSNEKGLVYASLDTDWQTDNLSPTSSQRRSLALDIAAQPHIAFINNELFFASRMEQWKAEVVSQHATEMQLDLSIANEPRVAYASPEGVMLATRKDGQWTSQLVEANIKLADTTTVQSRLVLAVSKKSVVHLAYITAEGIRYAVSEPKRWRIEWVGSETLRLQAQSGLFLKLDDKDAAHLCFEDRKTHELAAIVRDKDGWRSRAALAGADQTAIGENLQCILDSFNRPHALFTTRKEIQGVSVATLSYATVESNDAQPQK